MNKLLLLAFAFAFTLSPPTWAQAAREPGNKTSDEHAHHHMGHRMDSEGTVMNENTDRAPADCKEIEEDVHITIRAGRKYARRGGVFGFDQNEWNVAPCARVTVTFVNEDEVRHQWMVHGLPKYLYREGMFHMEANGGFRKTGTFIVSSNRKTYLAHCDLAQHMEKGMKGQLKVDGGDGDLPSVPGLTAGLYTDTYPVAWSISGFIPILVTVGAGIGLGLLGLARVSKKNEQEF